MQPRQTILDATPGRRKYRVSVVSLIALCVISPGASALQPIDTDGPDFVESSEAVPKGHFQYEIDLTMASDSRSAPHTALFSTPTLLKYGIADNVEIRIAPEGYLRQDGKSGAGDTAIGLKWHTQDRDPAAGKPAISWLLHFDTPSGTHRFQGQGIRPSLRSVLTWDLPEDFALGLMPGVKYDSADDGHRFMSGIFGAVLNKRMTENFRAFVELSAPQLASARNGGVVASWDLGMAYLARNDTQLGVRAGVAANRNSPAGTLLFEVAQRF